MSRVLVIDPGYELEQVRELLDGTGVAAERADPPGRGGDVVAILTSTDYPLTAADLEGLPALQIVASAGVGFDHVDLEAAAMRGVWVTNVPDYCVEEMADSALALLLALIRGVVALDRDVRAGGWDAKAAGPLRRVRGTRLGIVGFGRIGRALSARALALGMEVWASDPLVPAVEIERADVHPATLEELVATCEAISLHVPLAPETERLIDAAALARMPPGAVLVNTARARLVDEAALLEALASGRLAGAAVDVLPVEPPVEPPPLAPTLIVTPHAAWYSPESEAEVYRRPILAVRAVLDGHEPEGAVTRPR